MVCIEIRSSYKNLDDAWEYIKNYLNNTDSVIQLIIEEIVTNIYMHSQRIYDKEIDIDIDIRNNEIKIIASNVKNFDFNFYLSNSIDKIESYSMEDCGNIGLHLVNQLTTSHNYFYKNNKQYYEFNI